MAKDKIENRYTIEYINPDRSQEAPGGSGWLLKFGVIALLALGVAFSVFFPFKSIEKYLPNTVVEQTTETLPEVTNNEVVDVKKEKTQEQVNKRSAAEPIKVDVEKVAKADELSKKNNKLVEELNQLNSKIQAEKAQTKAMKKVLEERQLAIKEVDGSNTELTKKLGELKNQLLAEKEKNKALASQINATDSKNTELSKLLEDALKNASIVDKNYIDALDNYEEAQNNEQKISESSDAEIVDPKVIVSNEVTSSTTLDYNNAVSMETVSQVDAIIAAMQQVTNTSTQTTKKNETTNVINKVASKKTEVPLYLDLQQQINQLIEGKDSQFSNYKKVLSKESNVRSNAVRSIVVQKGETLWSIAKRAYGNGSFFKKILEANPHITKNGKIVLKEGQVIRVPI